MSEIGTPKPTPLCVDPMAVSRMAVLNRYDILDTDRDAIFDGIAELTAALLDVPMALVNFVADTRQFFKAEIGIGAREVPLEHSICHHVMPGGGIVVIPDLTLDPHFAKSPLVAGINGMRFYAGRVLEIDGVPIGAVCAIDTKPRPEGLTDNQRRGLEAIGLQTMAALERFASARRDRFRLALTEQLRDAADSEALMEVATRLLGEQLGVALVGFAEVQNDQAHIVVHREWNDGHLPSVLGRWRIAAFGEAFARDLKAGKTIVISDVAADERTSAPDVLSNYASAKTRALLDVGLIRDGQVRAMLFTHHHEPRNWRVEEVELVEETVQRLWAAVERRRAEMESRVRTREIEALINNAPIGLAYFDDEHRYLRINDELAAINGLPVADHIGVSIDELLPINAKFVSPALDKVLATGKNARAIEVTGDTPLAPGVLRHWLTSYFPVFDDSGTAVSVGAWVIDITERKRAEDAQKEIAARLEQAQELGGIGSWEWDHRTGLASVSGSYSVLHGIDYHKTSVSNEDLFEVMHPDDHGAFRETVQAALITGERVTVDYRIILPTTEVRHIRGVGQRIGAAGSTLTAGIAEDVTEQRAAQERLALLADAASRLLVANDPKAMFDELFELISRPLKLDSFSNYQLCEDGGLKLVAHADVFEGGGTAPLQIESGEGICGRVAQDRSRMIVAGIQSSADPLHASIKLQGLDHYACCPLLVGDRLHGALGFGRRAGKRFDDDEQAFLQTVSHYVAMALERVCDEEELQSLNASLEAQITARTSELVRANRALQSEIKRREAAQAALLQGQKLEALGQLTSGIAHDFNNILSAIAGGMDLIERRTEDKNVRYLTGHCKDAAFKGARLIKQMLSFARQEVLAPSVVNLVRLAKEVEPLIVQAIPGNKVTMDFCEGLPNVVVDSVMLESALLNLAVNARDAMPGGGNLTISAVTSDPGDKNHPLELVRVPAVAITVRDDGTGMPPEVVQRVTEPFFTTKAPGAGTGLGLAMVYGFVTQSGGAMRIASKPNKGTTITLFLPCATDEAEEVDFPPDKSDDIIKVGVGKILLVDDDSSVCAITAAQLRALGYTITEAGGLSEAMTIFEAGAQFDCIVSDVVMPGGDGIALAAAVRLTNHSLPFVFVTGRADSERVAGETVVQKPFKLAELANAVANAIDRAAQEDAVLQKILLRCQSQYVAAVINHWSARKIVGKVPAFASFDPEMCANPHKLAIVKADPSQLPMRFEVVSAGRDLEERLGRPLSGNALDVRGADGFGSIEESYRRSVKTGLPVFDYMRMDFGEGEPERFERVILPYSSDGGIVDRLVSVVVFATDTAKVGKQK